MIGLRAGAVRLRADWPPYGGGSVCSAACSTTRRTAGTSLVVACTRAFATSRSHRATAALAACLSGFKPACRIERNPEVALQIADEAFDLAFIRHDGLGVLSSR